MDGGHMMRCYHREAGLLHQVADGAPQVGNGTASPGRVPLPHGVQPRMLHQQHCICAHGLIELSHLPNISIALLKGLQTVRNFASTVKALLIGLTRGTDDMLVATHNQSQSHNKHRLAYCMAQWLTTVRACTSAHCSYRITLPGMTFCWYI